MEDEMFFSGCSICNNLIWALEKTQLNSYIAPPNDLYLEYWEGIFSVKFNFNSLVLICSVVANIWAEYQAI